MGGRSFYKNKSNITVNKKVIEWKIDNSLQEIPLTSVK